MFLDVAMPCLPNLQEEDAPATVPDGGLVGPYRLGAEIGSGAMARVHDAVNVLTGQRAAVKVLHGRCRDQSEVVARFIREGRALQKMNHPNLVRVIDHGVSDEGDAWIAMERLEGVSLAQLIKNGPLPEARALSLMTGVAKALASVHARGMVHRDVKPENVFVVAPGTPAEEAKLIDFGVAHVASEDLGEHSIQYTSFGSILGSVAFMAPEQLDALGRDPTPAADVFSFAVTLYECVTGRLPFEGETLPEQMKARKRGAVIALDRQLPGVRFKAALEAFLRRGLAYAAENRAQNGLELLGELYALQGRPPSFFPPPARAARAGIRLEGVDGLSELRAGSAPPALLTGTPAPPVGGWAAPAHGLGSRLGAAIAGGIVAGSMTAFWLASVLHALHRL